MEKQAFNIAVDGPAGAGKSTIARLVAERLGFVYVDTGAMYRTIALFCLRREIALEDEAQVSSAVSEARITISHQDGVQQVMLNGENVSGLIRTEQVGNTASTISAYPAVRAHLLNLQRELAASTNVIMDGRDIGTCVLPKAQTKIYLTASPKVRAMRRFKELKEKGVMCNLQEIEQDIIERDQKDMNRLIAPLKQAEDAVFVDGSDMTIEEVVSAIIRAAKLHGLVV
jgi:cytidylate kinase